MAVIQNGVVVVLGRLPGDVDHGLVVEAVNDGIVLVEVRVVDQNGLLDLGLAHTDR